jgi:hypothetical protein
LSSSNDDDDYDDDAFATSLAQKTLFASVLDDPDGKKIVMLELNPSRFFEFLAGGSFNSQKN